METSFYIVDDDRTVRRILGRIIADHNLGTVIGETDDGEAAAREIAALRPDIVLIDLLLPGMDGITLVDSLKPSCPDARFVMVSQVTDKEMVGKAYQAGVDFFINKPVNVIEVVSVLGQVRERRNLDGLIRTLRDAIGVMDQTPSPAPAAPDEEALQKRIRGSLARLGILGETGSDDIVELCLVMLRLPPEERSQLRMNDLYAALARKYAERGMRINAASVEQRIRRSVTKALNNLASLGIEDYGNDFFLSFGSAFFDFTEVRRQMNYIRGSGPSGKVNIKKFMEGLTTTVLDES